MNLADYDHPSLRTVVSTFVSYGVILVAMFLLLFVVPFLVFTVF